MKIDFNKGDSGAEKYSTGIMKGNFSKMKKMRKEKLADFQESIQDVLKDYDGETICIIVQKEDENGMPEQSRMLMAGCSRMESQVAMAASLAKASKTATKILLESAEGDVEAMLAIATTMVKVTKETEEEE